MGIGMVHQHFKLVMPFTVAENILLANRRSHYRTGISDIRAAIEQQSTELGFAIDPDRRINTLTLAEQQQVEIVKVLVSGAKILILDEPTAVLTDAEAESLLRPSAGWRSTGTAVVLITHKLHEVKRYADAVTIMRRGKTVATLDPVHRDRCGTDTAHRRRNRDRCRRARSDRHARMRLNVGALTCGRADGSAALRKRNLLRARRRDLRRRRRQRQRPGRTCRSADRRARAERRGEIWVEEPRRHRA